MITVLDELCVGCGHCVPFCSVDALSVFGRAVVDPDLCIGCEVCIEYCPNTALRWVDT
ncbi:ferredoxin-2 [archaeon BMS3Abin16]|nr:ferredoxin-2 [archaeon BMS3Abin16]GBE56487.1 ferredoxin-2 [archaeon BMS3Bbin16]